MIIVYFNYYADGKFHDTHDLPSRFNDMNAATKFIESMRALYKVTKVEIEYTE